MNERGIYSFETDYADCAAEIRAKVDFLISDLLGPLESLEILPPTEADAAGCIESGLRLEGTLRCKWREHDAPLDLKLPLPYHGVFIFNGRGSAPSSRDGLWSWLPRLSRKSGIWQVAKPCLSFPTPEARMEVAPSRLEIVFDSTARFYFKRQSNGSYLFQPEPIGRYPQNAFLWHPAAWPRSLLTELGWSADRPQLVKRAKPLVSSIERIVAWTSSSLDKAPVIFGDDLSFQTLFTFESWLREQLPIRLAHAIAADKDCAPREFSASQRLQKLAGHTGDIAAALFPLRQLREEGRLLLFAPCNPIDAISQLTRFNRYGLPTNSREYLKPVVHQNHPSFYGAICPVETPESEMAGITLHLSRAPRSKADWLRVDSRLISPRDTLGFAANLIPFFEYNDGSRNMMGAKNMKQALPVSGGHVPAINTDGDREIMAALRPLVELGIVPSMQDTNGRLATGKDLLVAYLPFNGLNFEDGVVARAAIAQDLSYEEKKTIAIDLPHTYRRGSVAESPFSAMHGGLDEHLLVMPGARVQHGDPLAILIDTTKEKIGLPHESAEVVFRYEFLEDGIVEAATLTLDSLGGGHLVVAIRKRFPLAIGDKIMGRHGNKGVIARLLPDEEMPRLPDDPGLPAALRNRPVDLVLNPHGVVSRMNLGQLLEVHLGWLHYAGELLSPPLSCGPFARQAAGRSKEISRALVATGLDEGGRIPLLLAGGRRTEAPVTVGFQHIIRLRHIPAKKIQARHGGADEPYDTTTGQPVKGRINLGGQRMGEMEVWALAAHGATALINDLLQHRSFVPTNPASAQYTWKALRDHFFALGIAIEPEESALRFGVLKKPAKEWSSGPIASERTFEPTLRVRFHCPVCNATPSEMAGSFEVERGEAPKLPLGLVLAKCGFAWEKPPRVISEGPKEITARWKLHRIEDKSATLDANIRCTENRTSFRLEIEIPSSSAEAKRVCCTARKPNPEFGATRDSLFRPSSATVGLQGLADVYVTCPHHASQPLAVYVRREFQRGVAGGLRCARIFGVDPDNRTRWGHIELPEPVENPLFKKGARKSKGAIPRLKAIPVLPLVYRRPRNTSDTERLEDDELTRRGYAPLVRAVLAYRRYSENGVKIDAKKLGYLGAQIEKAVETLFDLIGHRIADKETGLIRQHSLGRRADRSGRAVIVPAPELRPDQCRVPAKILAAIAGEDIAADFVVDNSERESEPVRAALRRGHLPSESLLPVALQGMRNFFHRHPDKLVLLNRQPSLHKYSILAFRPVVAEADAVIGLHPLACAPLGADFDGDEITIHWPSTGDAQQEATRLLLENNLISVAHGQSVIQFSQDLVLGLFLHRQSGRQHVVLDALPEDCRPSLLNAQRWTAKEIGSCLTLIAKRHPKEALSVYQKLMELSLRLATQHGTSFGYFDCLACRPESIAGNVGDAVLQRLEQALTAPRLGQGLAEMVLSKARGDKQIVQIVATRGILSPGLVSFPTTESDFTFTHSLADGCDAETFFRTAFNNRSSQCDKKLGTGIAGGITRSMVGLLWDFVSKTGEPIGLLAAQSIGERGTQLSMQSFHTGKQAFTANDVRDLIFRKSWTDAAALTEALSAIPAYKEIDRRHFEVLFSGLARGKSAGVLRELAFSGQERILKVAARAALTGEADQATHPVATVMMNAATPR
jgi:hypothetical protein